MNSRPSPFRSPLSLTLFFGTTAIGLTIDLWTKVIAVARLADRAPMQFITGWLHFTFTENRGAVFGIGQGQRALFIAVSIGAIIFLTYLFWQSGRQRLYQLILGMLLAGVLGNMYDRIRFGHVRDMIHALPGWKWPGTSVDVFPWIFNVADSLLCVGVFLMIAHSFLGRQRSGQGAGASPSVNPK
jgi:signal peptidase II